METQFPGRVRFFLSGAEKSFRRHVENVCQERGYSPNESWTVRFGYNTQQSGNLSYHLDWAVSKFKGSIGEYNRTRVVANLAANTICPERTPPSGGGASRARTSHIHFFNFIGPWLLGVRNFTGSTISGFYDAPSLADKRTSSVFQPYHVQGMVQAMAFNPQMTYGPSLIWLPFSPMILVR